MQDHATMILSGGNLGGVDVAIPSPGSPPAMSSSKSSKASSLRSFNSDEDDSVIVGVAGHFEDIGLDDDSITVHHSHFRDTNIKAKPNPYSPNFTADLRKTSTKHVGAKFHSNNRDLARPRLPRNVTPTAFYKTRPVPPSLTTHFRDASTFNLGLGIGTELHTSPLPMRRSSLRSASTASTVRRPRSQSPNLPIRSLSPGGPSNLHPLRRSSSTSSRRSKSTIELERECDEDDEDDIPDGLILDNVPLSPRPPTERSASRPSSASTSPERKPKERVRSVGNGTPPVAADSGSLKSPSWKIDNVSHGPLLPLVGRAKSWTAAISGLSTETKALTERLEEYDDELDKNGVYHSTYNRSASKPRVKSALAELPPLRRTNIMIDPLPVSKEKEAVLSRTRPSWLPPKDPAEEKKHLKAYQKMMASSIEAEKKRETSRKEKEQSRDDTADVLMRVWEEDILLNWDRAVRHGQARKLCWRGIAPRSRGAVWSRAIGNSLGLSNASFEAALTRSREVELRVANAAASTEDERRMVWFTQIQTDVEERTWLDLKIFQTGGPLNQSLIDILRAYSMYRSDIGYVTGCHTIAALLLLNIANQADAFIALANILNRSLPLSFYASDLGAQSTACTLVHQGLAAKSPQLHKHLSSPGFELGCDRYIGDIFTALFTQHLTLDQSTRLWDVYVFEGDSILVNAAVALLLEKEMALLGATTSCEVRKLLQNVAAIPGKDDEWMAKVRGAGKS